MAKTKAQVWQKLDRIENAIVVMTDRLEQSAIGLTSEDVVDIKKILRGEDGETHASE